MRAWLGCLFVFALSAGVIAGQAAPERATRAAARDSRSKVAASYIAAKKSAEGNYLSSLSQTVKWLVTLDAKAEATTLLNEMREVNGEYSNLKSLETLVADVAAPKALEDAKRKEMDARLLSARRSRAGDLTRLARTCYEAGLMAYAYEIMWDALHCDPDNAICRAAVGHEHVDKEWVSRYAAKQMAQGNAYCPNVGWVPKGALDRYKGGEWCEAGKWMPIADANKAHATIGNPWVIETENFTLKSTATREKAIEIAERLEATRELCFRAYLEFFMRGSKSRGTQLLFNAPSDKKLIVNYYGSKNDYIEGLNALPRASDLLRRSAGCYMSDQHASFFYYDPNFGPFQLKVMQHEVVHQILGEYVTIGGGAARMPWLSEGVAMCLEHGGIGPDGRLELFDGYENPDVAACARTLKQGKLQAVPGLISLKHEYFHAEPGRHEHYVESGALCRFIMDYKDGSYTKDFLEYLYDCYKGDGANLTDYLGLEPAELDTAFKAWLEGYKTPVMKAEAKIPAAKADRAKQPDDDGLRRGPGGENPFIRRED
jgi:hypothetical protein